MFSLDIAKKKDPLALIFCQMRFPQTLKNCIGIKCLIRRKLRCWHPSHVTWSRDFTHLDFSTSKSAPMAGALRIAQVLQYFR